jgi:serine/threonine protein phosphatase PrpC
MGLVETTYAVDTDWIALGASVRGILHLRRDQPNQDAVAWSRASIRGGPIAVAVADGHGSFRHPRSAEGAQIAVEIAVALLEDWLRTAPAHDDGADLPDAMLEAWRSEVEMHFAAHPLSELPEEYDPQGLYGSTLLAAGIYQGRMICLQIGDGEILGLARDGAMFRPLPASPNCFDNFTDSLCQEDAADRFRVAVVEDDVALLLLASDGYVNSYADREAFEEIGPDYLALLNRAGADRVASGLPGWLAEITRTGSGDDITLGLLWAAPE